MPERSESSLQAEMAKCAATAWQADMQLGYLRYRQKPRRCKCRKDSARVSYRCDYCGPFHRMKEKAEDRIAELWAERAEAIGFDLEASADELCEGVDAEIQQRLRWCGACRGMGTRGGAAIENSVPEVCPDCDGKGERDAA